jgi:catechol 2,3-dioxygenase-like lactoylglutathione lyase family enzyme
MLKQILHTGVAVADLAKEVALYLKLGFEVANEFEKPEPKAKVATMKKGEAAFELWQFADHAHPQVAFIRNHIAIYSDDLENDVKQLVAEGYKLVIPITEGVVLRYAFVQDAVGACYEIATSKGEQA